ncbi:hypothetical protein E2C01_058663 [Portunus trituberculatus]|uniref:Uncharacterized protein n=1 Tax=Portunus trituberculatus TaxID=210409 RepID=A0A5B7H4R6_PORTR|nr:hypothetical protein [Portunus trituberculatus]
MQTRQHYHDHSHHHHHHHHHLLNTKPPGTFTYQAKGVCCLSCFLAGRGRGII